MIKSSPAIILIVMAICTSVSLVRVPFVAYGFQQLSRKFSPGRPWASRHPFSSYNYLVGSVPFSNTHLAISSRPSDPSTVMLQLAVPTADELEEIGALLAVVSSPPDVIFLDGDLGSGKTTLARGFVHCKLGLENDDDQTLRVTSPTYLLSNTYSYQDENSGKQQEIHHIDLYRLSGTSSDFEALHLDRVFTNCISLVEWPNRLQSQPQRLPSNTYRLDVTISIVPQSNTRLMTLKAPSGSTWKERLQSILDEGMVDDLLCAK